MSEWVQLGDGECDEPWYRVKDVGDNVYLQLSPDRYHCCEEDHSIGLTFDELERIPHVAAIIAERDALRKRVQELEESNKPQGWTYSSLTNAYLGIPEGIGPSARTSMTQPLPPSEEISDG